MNDLTVELIRLIPSFLWILLVGIVLLSLRKPIAQDLIPRLSGVKLFGIELNLLKSQLGEALKSRGIVNAHPSQVLQRAARARPAVEGAEVLWVDDNPSLIRSEQRILESLGAHVQLAQGTEEGLSAARKADLDLIISDMKRGPSATAGLDLLHRLQKDGLPVPVIFYVADLDSSRGAPAGSFGITNRPDELLHLIMDALERRY